MTLTNPILLTDDAFHALCLLYSGEDISFVSDSCVEPLFAYDLIETKFVDYDLSCDPPVEKRSAPVITERGKAYVETCRRHNLKFNQQMQPFREMADTMKRDLEAAEIEAHSAAVRSWFAIGVSIAAIIVSVIVAIFF